MEEAESSLVDPEPLSTLLIVLGALGSIASLYAVVDQCVSSARTEREGNRFAVRDSLMGAETSLNELRGYIRSLEIAFVTGATRRGDHDPMMSFAGFGGVSLMFSRDGHERWREIEEGILSAVARVQRSMSELMRQFSVTHVKLSPDTAVRLQKTLEALNKIVANLGRVHFGELVRILDEAANECMDTLRQLRFDLGGFLRGR